MIQWNVWDSQIFDTADSKIQDVIVTDMLKKWTRAEKKKS